MPGPCQFPFCKSNAVNGIYCIGHEKIMEVPAAPKVIKPIPKISKKMAKIMKENRKDVDNAVRSEALCVIKSPACTKEVEGFHHIQKRTPKNIELKTNKAPCCNACNLFIELNVGWAKAHGWWKSKHSKPEIEIITAAEYLEFEEIK